MKKRDLLQLGLQGKLEISEALKLASNMRRQGLNKKEFHTKLRQVCISPEDFVEHSYFGKLASLIQGRSTPAYAFKQLEYPYWGNDIDDQAHAQMRNACQLPVAHSAALMPDAHVGYGLPIGGVLATEDAIIPYAVGVDIACRVRLTILDRPVSDLKKKLAELRHAIEKNTAFGIGASFDSPHEHSVLDLDWRISSLTSGLKDLAWKQLGSSGSGNHFVEFGSIHLPQKHENLEPGEYLALVSHSGSRGPGAKVANYYSRLARKLHPDLPKHLQHLAWLSMQEEGAEYWEAMQLMGAYAQANHEVIHRQILQALASESIYAIENHHNFAWKEKHFGKELIVHRKGATPAGQGVMGFIPGTMVDPGFLVCGRGIESSLMSCSHGAGRCMSRTQARQSTTKKSLAQAVQDRGVELLSAGLDESPHAYKDVQQVMSDQSELIDIIAKFQPRVVKMAAEGEPAED